MSYSNNTARLLLHLCDPSKNSNISTYVANVTSSYTDQSNEVSMVSASIIMFVLAGLFFNLNLFSGLSDVSAILDPKVRLLLTSALSLFLPVMSYLFSEAKNAGAGYKSSAGASQRADLPLRAGVILVWMLLVELLRKKVDEIHMRGYSGTIQRAGRIVWLGSLVFFNIRSAGRKAVFGVLWVLCAAKLVQRIAFTEVGKRSYAYGKNARLLSSYMSKILAQELHATHVTVQTCKYIVMGEEELIIEATADGYELKDISSAETVVTVGKVWELAGENDRVFADIDKDQWLKRLCLSFALFKLLRRRFEHLPVMAKAEARECRDLFFSGLYNKTEDSAEALFQMMNNEVNFLSEYYHSVIPVVLASPFFFLANYFLLPIVVLGLCLMTVILCADGDVAYAFSSIKTDNFAISSGIINTTVCLLAQIFKEPPAFFTVVDFFITFLLIIIFFYEEIWEFVVFLLSNWFMVSLLCNYAAKAAKPHCSALPATTRHSPTFSGTVIRLILWMRSKMGHPILSFKQFSVLNLCWPITLGPPAMLSLLLRTKPVTKKVKHYIMESLVAHCHDSYNAPLSNGKSALALAGQNELLWACESESVAEVILTWHIATSVLEVECPPKSDRQSKDTSKVATRLSKYCAYLVAFHPELLPDNQDKAERVFEDMKEELKGRLRCCDYYFSCGRTPVDRIMATASAAADWKGKGTVHKGAKLGNLLKDKVINGNDEQLERTWKLLADVWTELIIYVAPSSDEERVMGHEKVLVEGGEFITVLWALATHTGITRPAKNFTSGDNPEC